MNIEARTGLDLYDFQGGEDGADPTSGVIDIKSIICGTTVYGGSTNPGCNDNGCDTVFRLDPTSAAETVLYRFQGGADGALPSGLTYFRGEIYGTTSSGGSSNCQCGTVFRMPLSGGTPTTLHAFTGGTDGSDPLSPLLAVGHLLYGTTYNGGTGSCNSGNGCGTLFSIDPRTGTEKTLYSFKGGRDGAEPKYNLVQLHGKLYGVTSYGGTSDCRGRTGCGVLYQFDLATHKERVIFAFRVPGTSWNSADATITLAGNTIYGTTRVNNTGFNGTIFSYTP